MHCLHLTTRWPHWFIFLNLCYSVKVPDEMNTVKLNKYTLYTQCVVCDIVQTLTGQKVYNLSSLGIHHPSSLSLRLITLANGHWSRYLLHFCFIPTSYSLSSINLTIKSIYLTGKDKLWLKSPLEQKSGSTERKSRPQSTRHWITWNILKHSFSQIHFQTQVQMLPASEWKWHVTTQIEGDCEASRMCCLHSGLFLCRR